MHIWWRLWVFTKILLMVTAWCGLCDICLSVVLLFYCNWYTVITSHLVHCLLPQKCFKFYITVLTFSKWCTSCLCIICSTLVKKSTINLFYFKSVLNEFHSGGNSVGGLLLIILSLHVGLKKKKRFLIEIVHLVAYICAAFIQIWTICCVYSENCMRIQTKEVLLTSPLLWPPFGMMKKSGHGLDPFIVSLCWVHLCYSCALSTLPGNCAVELEYKFEKYWFGAS